MKGRIKPSVYFVLAILVLMAITAFLLVLLSGATILRFTGSSLNIRISHRAYEFGYILIGAMSALFFIQIISFVRMHKKSTVNIILICSWILVMIVGPMAGGMHPRTLARLAEVVSPNGLSLNTWMSESGAAGEYTVSDEPMHLILQGYGESMVIRARELFISEDFSLLADASYVAIYSYMSDFYGTNISSFDNSLYLHNLYTNGIIKVYRIINSTSS